MIELVPGTNINRYAIISEIGEGGMQKVYGDAANLLI